MSLLDPAAARRARVASAHQHAALARAHVAACARVPWVGSGADAYRAAVDDEHGRLDRLVAALEAALAGLGLPGPWPPTMGQIAAAATCWGALGRSVRVGGDFVAVDPQALADAGVRLGRAADDLDAAGTDLSRAVWESATAGLPLRGNAAGLADLLLSPVAPGRSAARLRDLGAAARASAQLHADGETRAHRRMREAAGSEGRVPVLDAVRVLSVAAAGVVHAEWTAARAVATGRDPRAELTRAAERAWADAMARGGGEVAASGLAGLLTAAVPPVLPDTVAVVSGGLAGFARGGGDVTLVPRADPPQLAAPRGLEGILDVVATTSREGQPTATVTVERLDHPDGSRSWLVAIPGTQSWAMDRDIATDLGTNLQLVGGRGDPMTAGVVAAMGAAGIRPDEPVVLAGHSQGGMVAMAAAAVLGGTYRIGGVVTAGSPTVPGRLPAGVPVVRLEHDEDIVPQADGEPTVAGGDVTRIRRALADDQPIPVAEAHAITNYRQTARLTDAAEAALPGSAPGVGAITAVLGGDGTTATTVQYRVERAR